ncbi:Disease resistance protein TAO1 [Heracleum sosnowskyi]|uniref:Disease resistance protein TAO1 n=1 Tax=Heracleum sosnowskyi TaxID=360622 RepID=A0AAD8H9T3_9APIA|nr:Disease resistance protein TAO1 [Heracleum sosnowskyi]
MKRVGDKSGLVLGENQFSQKSEGIETLVNRILTELSNSPEVVAPCAVGLESRLDTLWKMIDLTSKDVQVLGLFGMGGVGKTTLAKALYNKLFGQFANRIFMSDVRETSKRSGLVTLQNMLLHLVDEKPVSDELSGTRMLKRVLQDKRVLIVLDDIDDSRQLNALAASKAWFHEGSILIITTRDRGVLPAPLVNEVYEVRELEISDSIKLLSYHALRRDQPTEPFMDMSHKIVLLTGGLPLALEVFGSFLFDMRKLKEWEEALQNLRQVSPRRLQDVLMISFDGLDKQEQCIFLDIACLLQNLKFTRDDTVDIMRGCGFGAESAIKVLIARSLIKVKADNTFWMHDQIIDMGRQIIQNENLVDPGMRSRLWDQGDIQGVLLNRKGTRNVQGITLDFDKRQRKKPGVLSAQTIARSNLQKNPGVVSALAYLKLRFKDYCEREGEIVFFTKSFEPMINLRMLYISNVTLKGNFKHFPAELKWLQWRKCPLDYLPSFYPQELTVLDLAESKLKNIWGPQRWSWYNNKVEGKLMILNLHSCYNLTAVPDLSGQPNLEKLILEGCIELTRIHKSVGDLKKLLYLNMSRCSNLVEFPTDVSGLKCLKNLVLSKCSKLKELPQDMGNMSSLVELLLDDTAIEKLPESIFRLTKLELLSMKGCRSLKQLPFCIGKLVSLKKLVLNDSSLEYIPDSVRTLGNLEELSLMRCTSLTAIPDSVGDLKSLCKFWLNGCSITEMPDCIGSLYYLKVLSVGECRNLNIVPASIGQLASIIELQLDGTSIVSLPDQIGSLKSLQKLEMRNCKSLTSLPETFGKLLTLQTLIIVNAAIQKLPESFGLLENLFMLRLNNCKHLCSLPSSFGNLKSLCHLHMIKTALRDLPESFGMLSSLMVLEMGKERWAEAPLDAEAPIVALPSTFSNLSLLTVLNVCAWKITRDIPDDFESLSLLKDINLGHNDFCHLPSSLRKLHFLEKLNLAHCKKLRFLPPLPSSLTELNAANCIALETISDLSNLEHLTDMHLSNCEKLVDVPGFECLKSLTRLHMCGCSSCSPVLKEKLNKSALRNLKNLSMPGSDLPCWLTQKVVRFSEQKNLVIRGIIIGIVVSVDQHVQNDIRDQLPVLFGIYAKIIRLNMPVFTSAMNLHGVPKTHEDQVYLCRYGHYTPLVSLLEDGDVVEVSVNEVPHLKGVKVKKSGVHIIFENDDDYDGNEEYLDESQLSVSEKLSKFLKSSELDNVTNSSDEVDKTMQESGSRADVKSSHRIPLFIIFFLSCFIVFISWLVLPLVSLK